MRDRFHLGNISRFVQSADQQVLGSNNLGMRLLPGRQHFRPYVDSCLLIVGNRDFDLSPLRQIFRQGFDQARPQFNVVVIGRRPAFDDTKMDPSLTV